MELTTKWFHFKASDWTMNGAFALLAIVARYWL